MITTKEYIIKGTKILTNIKVLEKKLENCTDAVEIPKIESEIHRLQKEFNRIFDIVFK